jgi:hypothetical protein
LAGQHLAQLVLNADRVVAEERLLTDFKQRVRDVAKWLSAKRGARTLACLVGTRANTSARIAETFTRL